MIVIEDAGLRQAVEQLVGHQGPFPEQALAAQTGSLTVRNSADLEGLQYFKQIVALEIVASSPSDWTALGSLVELQSLMIKFSTFDNLKLLLYLSNLTHLDVAFTYVQDLRPLLAMTTLRTVLFCGNPWNDDSFNVLRPRLLFERTGQHAPLIRFSSRADWNATRLLWSHHVHLCFAQLDGGNAVVVKPGIAENEARICNYLRLTGSGSLSLALARRSHWDTDAFFRLGKPKKGVQIDWSQHYHMCDAAEMLRRIQAASLDDTSKLSLQQFVTKFPDLIYYHVSADWLDRFEQRQRVTLPLWFRTLQQILSLVFPNLLVCIQFQAPEPIEHLANEWYRLDLIGYDSEAERQVLEAQADTTLFPIGEAYPSQGSTLAIDLQSGANQAIYEYFDEDIYVWPVQTEGQVASFPYLLALIQRVKVIDNQREFVFEATQADNIN